VTDLQVGNENLNLGCGSDDQVELYVARRPFADKISENVDVALDSIFISLKLNLLYVTLVSSCKKKKRKHARRAAIFG
jgi:hypothetical protein